jgi:hypothetical protein
MTLTLSINLHQISDAQWQTAYRTVQRIFEAFPVQLMRLDIREKYGEEYYAWTRNLCVEEGTENERIDVRGDWASYERGGNFRLYKHRAAQIADMKRSKDQFYDPRPDDKSFDPKKDVLYLPKMFWDWEK